MIKFIGFLSLSAVFIIFPKLLGEFQQFIADDISLMSISNTISVFSYALGIFFITIAVFELIAERGGSLHYVEQKKAKEEIPKEIINKQNLNDQNMEVLISKIKVKSSELLSNPQINDEIELKHIVEKSVSSYLPKVIDAYTAISPELQKKCVKNELSAHDMAYQQLEVIYIGLSDIELELLNKNHDKLKVSGKFLNQIFKKKDKAEKVIELEM